MLFSFLCPLESSLCRICFFEGISWSVLEVPGIEWIEQWVVPCSSIDLFTQWFALVNNAINYFEVCCLKTVKFLDTVVLLDHLISVENSECLEEWWKFLINFFDGWSHSQTVHDKFSIWYGPSQYHDEDRTRATEKHWWGLGNAEIKCVTWLHIVIWIINIHILVIEDLEVIHNTESIEQHH